MDNAIEILKPIIAIAVAAIFIFITVLFVRKIREAESKSKKRRQEFLKELEENPEEAAEALKLASAFFPGIDKNLKEKEIADAKHKQEIFNIESDQLDRQIEQKIKVERNKAEIAVLLAKTSLTEEELRRLEELRKMKAEADLAAQKVRREQYQADVEEHVRDKTTNRK